MNFRIAITFAAFFSIANLQSFPVYAEEDRASIVLITPARNPPETFWQTTIDLMAEASQQLGFELETLYANNNPVAYSWISDEISV